MARHPVPGLLLLVSACAVATGCVVVAPPAPPAPPVDALRASLAKADNDFAADSARRGAEAWADVFAEDGASLRADGSMARGKAAIRQEMAPVLAKMQIDWHPALVEVAPSGDMGFTYGPYRVLKPGPGGAEVVAHGSYMTVWRRGADGVWKVVADMGSEAR